jgi:hypothetical protein
MTAGDVAGAYERFSEAADVHSRLLDQEGSAYCLDGFAGIALVQGRLEVAARLIGASAHARQLVGVSVWPGMQSMADQMVATVRGGLGETAFQRASAMGRQLHITAALSYARAATAAEADTEAGA